MAKKKFDIQLIGEKELQKIFKSLPDDIKPNVIKRIARKAAAPIRKRAREKAPVADGDLRKSIKIGVSKFPRRGRVAGVWVGPNYKRGKYRGPHAHLVAFGSEPRYTKKGAYRGRAMEHKSPIGDFVKDAASEVQRDTLHAMTKDLSQVIQSELKKKANRMSRKRIKI